MREALIKELEKISPAFSFGALQKENISKKPFLIVSIAGEVKTFSGSFTKIKIEIFVPINAPNLLDEMTKKVRIALHKKQLKKEHGEGYFFLEYLNYLGDFIETDYKALVRILEFKCACPPGGFL